MQPFIVSVFMKLNLEVYITLKIKYNKYERIHSCGHLYEGSVDYFCLIYIFVDKLSKLSDF
ncbi:hypothetical protein [Clostridium algidicarnis]|uniref:hypothetical protein n=1 Tax=Clostridium algidicarnis TaxID=37659 RepID=UPI001C0D9720|nr:hypothetical protein [Clostridium algidicarnis]MBU3193700.1 hypothetical protein [Clostridium algidicarnis]